MNSEQGDQGVQEHGKVIHNLLVLAEEQHQSAQAFEHIKKILRRISYLKRIVVKKLELSEQEESLAVLQDCRDNLNKAKEALRNGKYDKMLNFLREVMDMFSEWWNESGALILSKM